MTSMSASSDSTVPGLRLEYAAIDAAKVVSASSGPIETGFVELGQTDKLKAGVWVHPVGVSTDVEVDEVFVVLEGRGRVLLKDGTVLELFRAWSEL